MIRFQRWYADLTIADDDFEISISDDDGATWVPLETVSSTANLWVERTFVASDHVALTEEVRLRFVASDDPNNSIVEAAVDELSVVIYEDGPHINLFGSPVISTPLALHVAAEAGEQWVVYASQGTASLSLPGVVGDILLDPVGLQKLGGGVVPAGGLVRIVSPIPDDAALVGETFYVQAATVGAQIRMSNLSEITFE